MRKNIIALIFLVSCFAFFASDILAADLDVACDGSGCSASPSGPVFSETNIYPGWSTTKIVKGINNYGQDATFAVEITNLTNLDELSDVLTIAIKKSSDTTNIYEDNLTNFENYGYLKLSDISAGGNQDYDFNVKMEESADDQYKELNLSFDLTLGFELLPLPPGPTPTPSPLGCTASVPSAPTNLSAVAVSSSVINLTWAAPPETVTHYAVSYGFSSGSYIYGASNVGNVTSYTVSGLSSGTTYYFVVYAVNDCASSGPSNEASAVTTGVLGAFIVPGPAPGFEVLGEEIEGELGGGESIELGGVEGAAVEKICFWWLVFSLLALIINSIYVYEYREKMRLEKWRWLAPAVISVLAYFGDRFMHRWWTPSRLCSYMLIFSFVAFVVPLGLWYFRWRESVENQT